MSEQKQPKAIKRAIGSRAKNKQVSPGARQLNRTGGGTPPSSTVTSQYRIIGIKRAMLKAALESLVDVDDRTGLMVDQLRYLIGMEPYDYDLPRDVREYVEAAFDYAVEAVPDSLKLPKGVLKREPKRPTPKRKPAPVQTLQVTSTIRRTVTDGDRPISQIERILHGEAQTTAPERKLQPGVKVLPVQRDTAAMARVMAAARRR